MSMEPVGIDGSELTDEELLRELGSLYRTRMDTLRHASDAALGTHLARTTDLEAEYLRRWPEREVDPRRLRDGMDGGAGSGAATGAATGATGTAARDS
jgi:hypothetical protein